LVSSKETIEITENVIFILFGFIHRHVGLIVRFVLFGWIGLMVLFLVGSRCVCVTLSLVLTSI
jgi:hypothetical protein